jgi:hypothetical protein
VRSAGLCKASSFSQAVNKGMEGQQKHVLVISIEVRITVCVLGQLCMLTFLQNSDPIWLPHWPTCNVMISRGMPA